MPVRYLQLVHNTWDPVAGAAKMKVLHSFGREDELDRAAIERLIASLSKLLHPSGGLTGPIVAGATPSGGSGLEFVSSRALGATWALDGVWSQLGLDTMLRRLLEGTRREARTERIIFGLVAARAIEPGSKLATAGWLTRRTHIGGLTAGLTDGDGESGAVSEDECYRGMDWLIDAAPQLEAEVFWSVASLLDLEVDLLFFDTTSTYFEIDEGDEPVLRDDRGHPGDPTPAGGDPAGGGEGDRWRAGFRTWGKSKDTRGDLPQIVIGMAVTRGGIPVRVWSWPGNTTDSALIRQAKAELREWNLGRVVWVGDRGFTSAANRADLRRGGHAYILGEKLRSGSAEATAALSRQGRYATVAGNLQVKEVKITDDERFIVCFNPEQALRDAALREVMIGKLEALIGSSDALSATKRAELAGRISASPGPHRYLRRTPAGLLRVDRAKAATEAKLDGKYLLRCSDPHISAADIALGYKQLIQVERGWRDLKTHLELRPVYHRLEHRIRAHVLLCWLALLLVRIVETRTGRTWTDVRDDLQDLHVGVFTGPAGTFTQTSTPTPGARDALAALGVAPPKKILDLRPAATAEPAGNAPTSQDLTAS